MEPVLTDRCQPACFFQPSEQKTGPVIEQHLNTGGCVVLFNVSKISEQ